MCRLSVRITISWCLPEQAFSLWYQLQWRNSRIIVQLWRIWAIRLACLFMQQQSLARLEGGAVAEWSLVRENKRKIPGSPIMHGKYQIAYTGIHKTLQVLGRIKLAGIRQSSKLKTEPGLSESSPSPFQLSEQEWAFDAKKNAGQKTVEQFSFPLKRSEVEVAAAITLVQQFFPFRNPSCQEIGSKLFFLVQDSKWRIKGEKEREEEEQKGWVEKKERTEEVSKRIGDWRREKVG